MSRPECIQKLPYCLKEIHKYSNEHRITDTGNWGWVTFNFRHKQSEAIVLKSMNYKKLAVYTSIFKLP